MFPLITYLLWLLAVLASYALAAHLVKQLYLRLHQLWL